MNQILEGLVSLRTKISGLIHYKVANSFNKTEFHFYGPVNFISRRTKAIKNKIRSPLLPGIQ